MKNKIVLKGIVKWSSGIVAVLLFVVINVMSAKAYTYGDLSYTIVNGEVTITDCDNSASGEMVIPDEIDGYPVTSIGETAFKECSGLTSISLPESVTSIGHYAFYGCSSLTSVSIPDNVTSIGYSTFSGCSSLTSVSIPDNVTSIGSYAFRGCSGLTSISLPENLTYIGDDAFSGCDGLTSITIPKSVTRIGSSTFYECSSLTSVSIPDNVTSIGSSTFYECSSLTSVTIPSSVTSIGNYAFFGCSSLTSVSIPDNVTSIGSSAFQWCSGLANISLPENLTYIGNYAFSGCDGLTSITIPKSLTSIGESAFRGCSGLVSMTMPFVGGSRTANTYLGYVFGASNYSSNSTYIPIALKKVVITDSTSIGRHAFYGCNGLTSISLPEGLTSIGAGAFGECSGLTSIGLPEGLTNIGVGAFSGCDGLTSITIPKSLTSIGESAFGGCTSLTEIVIPESVTSIGSYAFYGCSGLANISLPENLTHIGACAFGECNGLTSISLPEGLTSIGARAFSECSGLTSIGLPEGLTNIGVGAFSGCDGLTSITIPKSLTSIGESAFGGCTSLTEIVIPESVTSIGSYAFRGCSGLANISLPENLTYISDYAFFGCDGLTSITIPKSLTSIGARAFSECNGLANISLPENLTYIGDYAFSGCDGLTSISLPEGLTNIGVGAFSGCDGLTSITIPKSLTSIGESAFGGCTSLTEIVIPESVTSIGSSAFRGCSGLVSMTMPFVGGSRTANTYLGYLFGASSYSSNSTYIPIALKKVIITDSTSIGSYAFYGCNGLTSISLPEGLTSIGSSAFSGCTNISDVWFDGGATEYYALSIASGNTCLTDATWYFNICADNGHLFSLNNELTCEYCGYSKKPQRPEIEKKTYNAIILVAHEAHEYSMDGETWQDSNIFSGLAENNVYKIFQRVRATSKSFVSESSDVLEVYIKLKQDQPTSPIISSYTDTTVTLVSITNGEYSIDGTTWQKDNVFDNLSSGTKYTFYQRYAETDTYEASASSAGTSVTTDKSKQTLIPNAPVVQSVSASSITLVPVEGCEYSKNGTTWQSSNVFSNLSCGTEHTFYQRYKETSSTYVGKSSEGTNARTDKGTQTAPSKPTLSSKTHVSVTLTEISGYEYSKDGVTWQTSNVFAGLNPETNYLFCQRKAETDTHYASEASPTLVVKTYDSEKIVQREMPSAPVIESCTSDSIILVYTEGCEYSSNGEDWQESNVFSGLSCATSHIFYQRYKETETTYAGISSKGTIIPPLPVVLNKTYNSVSLTKVDGCEYSLDGRNWQSSNIFSELVCGAEYEFYQRYKENTTPYVSQASMLTGVKTNQTITLGGHVDKETISVNKCDVKFEGEALCVLWQLTRGGEIIESKSYSSGDLNNRFTLHFDDMEEGRYILTYSIRPYTTSVSYYRDSQGNYVPSYTYTPTGTAKTYGLIINNEEKKAYITGDFNNDNAVTDADALYLLYHTIFGDSYPIEQDCDYNNDGSVTDADALYLLYHTIFGDSYPLN